MGSAAFVEMAGYSHAGLYLQLCRDFFEQMRCRLPLSVENSPLFRRKPHWHERRGRFLGRWRSDRSAPATPGQSGSRASQQSVAQIVRGVNVVSRAAGFSDVLTRRDRDQWDASPRRATSQTGRALDRMQHAVSLDSLRSNSLCRCEVVALCGYVQGRHEAQIAMHLARAGQSAHNRPQPAAVDEHHFAQMPRNQTPVAKQMRDRRASLPAWDRTRAPLAMHNGDSPTSRVSVVASMGSVAKRRAPFAAMVRGYVALPPVKVNSKCRSPLPYRVFGNIALRCRNAIRVGL